MAGKKVLKLTFVTHQNKNVQVIIQKPVNASSEMINEVMDQFIATGILDNVKTKKEAEYINTYFQQIKLN